MSKEIKESLNKIFLKINRTISNFKLTKFQKTLNHTQILT